MLTTQVAGICAFLGAVGQRPGGWPTFTLFVKAGGPRLARLRLRGTLRLRSGQALGHQVIKDAEHSVCPGISTVILTWSGIKLLMSYGRFAAFRASIEN